MSNSFSTDVYFQTLCQPYNESEIEEVEKYLAEWGAGTYLSVSQSVLDHSGGLKVMAKDIEDTVAKKNHVAHVLAQLSTDYQQASSERQVLRDYAINMDTEFTLLEELELLTVGVRGLGTQFVASASARADREAIVLQLKSMKVFDVAVISQFYFDDSVKSERMELYVSLLDYLRLLILEYSQINAVAESVAA